MNRDPHDSGPAGEPVNQSDLPSSRRKAATLTTRSGRPIVLYLLAMPLGVVLWVVSEGHSGLIRLGDVLVLFLYMAACHLLTCVLLWIDCRFEPSRNKAIAIAGVAALLFATFLYLSVPNF